MGEYFARAAALDEAFHMHTYGRKPVMFVRGEGMRLYDDDGREYLDFLAGIGVVNLGHAHPAVTAAVCEQQARLVHVSNLFQVEHRAELAELLVELAGGGRKVFFANSGAEANEGAIKLARRWGRREHGEGCFRVISAQRSFHGRTLATLAATGQPSKQEAFEPLPTGFAHVPLNDLAAMDAALDASVCAVLLEPVQGEAGVYPLDQAYIQAVRELCTSRGILLMFDEVQTGFWRTGPVFAHHAFGVNADVITLAKSLANGLPAGAVLATDEVASAFKPGDHGSTFGGGPVVCAAALATIGALQDEHLGENATRTGAYLCESLTALGTRTGEITQVRGAGLMVGVQLARPVAGAIGVLALENGFILNSIGDSILRLLPPLVCTTAEADALLASLETMLEAV